MREGLNVVVEIQEHDQADHEGDDTEDVGVESEDTLEVEK